MSDRAETKTVTDKTAEAENAKTKTATSKTAANRGTADFTFVTSNDHKVLTARAVCQEFGLRFTRQKADLVEIQSDDAAAIARDKARQAFLLVQRPNVKGSIAQGPIAKGPKGPVVITDDNWLIPGLRGFPGPYMKYVNHWFTPEDFIRLTKDLADRTIIMRHVIVYRDAQLEKVFSVDIPGTLLKQARGSSVIPHFAIMSFDGQHSVAEAEADGHTSAVARQPNAWHQLCAWLAAS
jgi:inosine/xanthosine triphosphate pyrophosphatase family protein